MFAIITTFADADPKETFKSGDAEIFRLRDALNISNFRLWSDTTTQESPPGSNTAGEEDLDARPQEGCAASIW